MIETEVKPERTDSDPLDGDAGVVSKSVTPLTRVFPSPAGLAAVEKLTVILHVQYDTKPAYIFKQPGVLFCLFTAPGSGWDSSGCVLLWTVANLLATATLLMLYANTTTMGKYQKGAKLYIFRIK